MNRRATEPLRPRPADAAATWCDWALFVLLAAVLCARPLMAESFERVELSFLASLGAPAQTPDATVWLDALLLLGAAGTFMRPRGRDAHALTPLLGIILLVASVVVSVSVASDRRAAANAGTNLVATALAVLALARVLRTEWMSRLLLAGLIAVGAATAYKCLNQYFWEFGATLEEWQRLKAQLAAQGHDVADPLIVNYQRRLLSREVFGYLAHANLAGSALMMVLLAGLGVLAGALRERRIGAGPPTLLGIVALGAVLLAAVVSLGLTGSAGAQAAALVGLLAAIALFVLRTRIARAPRAALTLLVIGYLVPVIVAGCYGVRNHTLPHSSLAFRWHYWTAAAQAIADSPWTGIGRENFAAAFQRYKPIENPEEVRNPHNLWLCLLAELGPLGALAAAILLVSLLIRGLRGLDPAEFRVSERAPPVAVFALVGSFGLVHALFSRSPLYDPAGAFLWAIELLGIWTLALLITDHVLSRLESPGGRAWVLVGLLAALVAALVHNLVCFSLVSPGGLALFAGLAGAALSRAGQSAPREASTPAKRRLPIASLATVLLLVLHVWLNLIPTVRTTAALDQLQKGLRTASNTEQVAAALAAGKRAMMLDRWAASGPRAMARATAQLALNAAIGRNQQYAWLELAAERAGLAQQRDPNSASNQILLASLAESQARLRLEDGQPGAARAALERAAQHWHAATGLSPANSQTRFSAGLCAWQLWRMTGSEAIRAAALAQFTAAERIDASRPPEEVVRLSPAERARLTAAVAELRGTAPPATTQPGAP